MTTSNSPLPKLKAQAESIARLLKAMERGEAIDPYGKMKEARATRDHTVFLLAMDDKALKIEMTWVSIRDRSEAAIAEEIVRLMLGVPPENTGERQ